MQTFRKCLLFLCCLASLLLSMYIFYHQGIAADELNLGAAQLFGGEPRLLMSWLRMFLLLIASVLSFINVVKKKAA